MNTQATQSPQFYLTAPAQCPYLEAERERKVFTHLVGPRAAEMNDLLTQGGFRRSQNIAYRPACENCRACVSVRIVAGEFDLTRSFRRTLSHNRDLVGTERPAIATDEQYDLFRTYLDSRHQRGGMADMTVDDYAVMVEETHVETRVIEYRVASGRLDEEGELIAVALSDVMMDGLSMVYSFFNPAHERRSLGSFMILDHVMRARNLGLPYVYLGYWVKGSKKMDYKKRFQPQEHLTGHGWERALADED
ncbi:arginyltransferase [Martelella endophytica]|uniref:Aspartate/glutamate leucyltransferase n=1 Tax=Martelella endophytica TaxID=1486262 RepID=A0A0D5LTY2_MAREN|nr:arginyltransferase [Martelella endophytica]AJY47679.1 arginyl-tRNA-protein transferase [Martelella endophytica]